MPEGQLYFGGEVVTMDDSRPSAKSVAVRDGVIIAAGSEEDCRSALGRDYEETNLRGRVLMPGFIDTHLHPLIAIYFDMNADLGGIKSIGEMKARLREQARTTPPSTWVMGLQFDDEGFDVPGLPTRYDLDEVCPDRPAIVIRHDGHMVIANSLAIEAAGYSASSPDPEGGRIDRDEKGEPIGVFRETATAKILSAAPLPDIQSLKDCASSTFGRLLSQGITSAGVVLQTDEEGPAGKSGAFDVIAMQMILEEIPISLYSLLITRHLDKVEAAKTTGLHKGANRIGGIKMFADGTYGSHTAYMYEPFSDRSDTRGFMVVNEEDLYRRMAEVHNAGLQIAVHAIGDAANRVCVDLYARLLKEFPKDDCRHRIEHASQLDAGTIADMARLGVVVSTQPMFIHSEKNWLHKRLGTERTKWTYPFRSLFDGGVIVAGASDAPVESTDVLHAIQCCVTREGFEPQQGITAAEAARMFTINAAYAQFEDSVKGSIAAGKRADMIVLSGNPLAAQPEKIRDIRVIRTIVGGKTAYRNE